MSSVDSNGIQRWHSLDESAGDLKNAFGGQVHSAAAVGSGLVHMVGGSVTWAGLDGFAPAIMVV